MVLHNVSKTIFCMVFAILLIVAAPHKSYAAEEIAVVDIQAIMRDSLAAQDIRDQIEKKRSAYMAEVNRQGEDLRKREQELVKQRSILSKEALEQKTKEFKTNFMEAQRDVQQRRTQLERAYNEALGEVHKASLAIIEGLAKEKGFQMAIPSSEILYAQPNLNITAEVLKRLNSQLTKVQVKIEPPVKK